MLACSGEGVKKVAVFGDSSPAAVDVQGKGLAWHDW
jgi:hypothetical protein